MKILLVGIRANHRAGWGKYCCMLFEAFATIREVNIQLAICKSESENVDVPVDFFLKSNKSLVFRWKNIVTDLFKFRHFWSSSNVIIAGDELSAPICFIASKLFNKKLVMVTHGTYSLLSLKSKKRFFYHTAYRSADAIIAVSNYTKAKICEKLPEIEKRVHVVPLAILLKPEPLPALRPPNNQFCLVGGIKPRKGALYAVKALEILTRKGLDVHLSIIGEQTHNDGYFRKVMEYVKAKELDDRISFTGFVSEEEKENIMATSIANLLPSVNEGDAFEGFGYVHLEAGRLGCPTIGSLDCGNEDAINDGVTGFLVPQRDEFVLAERMERLACNPDLRAKLGRQGQTNASKWTAEDITKAFTNILAKT